MLELCEIFHHTDQEHVFSFFSNYEQYRIQKLGSEKPTSMKSEWPPETVIVFLSNITGMGGPPAT